MSLMQAVLLPTLFAETSLLRCTAMVATQLPPFSPWTPADQAMPLAYIGFRGASVSNCLVANMHAR